MRVDHFAWFRQADGLATLEGNEVSQVHARPVTPTSLASGAITARAANLERRLERCQIECRAGQLRQIYRGDRGGYWTVAGIRRYQGDAGVVRPGRGWHPPRLDFGPEPKPVLRWRWA